MSPPSSPLSGIKVIEFAGLAPGPFCGEKHVFEYFQKLTHEYTGLFLADWGASVIRIDRPDQGTSVDLLARGKRSVALNSKTPAGRQLLRKLIAQADVVIDPFRPGVLERLGVGPDVFLGNDGLNPRLIISRIVGFTRIGHHKAMAGHDVNYLAISGILSMMPPSREDGRPSFPINLLADFAGGGLMAATGVLLALLERHTSGRGQIVETDMVSGARYVSSFPLIHSALRSPLFLNSTGSNMLDGGAPFYGVYRCKDGKWFTLGCIEPKFYAIFLKEFINALPVGFTAPGLAQRPSPETQLDREKWAGTRAFIEAGFLTKTRDEWTNVFDGTDACALPVLSPTEAVGHTTTFSAIPQPHPNLSRTPAPASVPGNSAALEATSSLTSGAHTREVLREIGITEAELEVLVKQGAIGSSSRITASL